MHVAFYIRESIDRVNTKTRKQLQTIDRSVARHLKIKAQTRDQSLVLTLDVSLPDQ